MSKNGCPQHSAVSHPTVWLSILRLSILFVAGQARLQQSGYAPPCTGNHFGSRSSPVLSQMGPCARVTSSESRQTINFAEAARRYNKTALASVRAVMATGQRQQVIHSKSSGHAQISPRQPKQLLASNSMDMAESCNCKGLADS